MLSKRDQQRLQKAIELAKTSMSKARQGSARHGAIVVAGGRVLGTGVNKDRNNVLNVTNARTEAAIHAEVAAIRAAGRTSLKGGTIYVARVSKLGKPAMSRPCENCQLILKEAGIKKIVYTIDRFMEI